MDVQPLSWASLFKLLCLLSHFLVVSYFHISWIWKKKKWKKSFSKYKCNNFEYKTHVKHGQIHEFHMNLSQNYFAKINFPLPYHAWRMSCHYPPHPSHIYHNPKIIRITFNACTTFILLGLTYCKTLKSKIKSHLQLLFFIYWFIIPHIWSFELH